MIKEKELRVMRDRVRYNNKSGDPVTLPSIQRALTAAAEEAGIPMAFYDDEVKIGGMLSSEVDKCLVVYHPEHQKDYFKICIRVKTQGNFAFVSFNDFGTSKLLGNQGSHDSLMDTLKNGSDAEIVGAVIGAGLRRLTKGGRNSSKMQEEQDWYSIVDEIFDTVFA